MAQKLRFRLPQIPCSIVGAVYDGFYGNRTKKVINQDSFQIHKWWHQRGDLQPEGESSVAGPMRLSDGAFSPVIGRSIEDQEVAFVMAPLFRAR